MATPSNVPSFTASAARRLAAILILAWTLLSPAAAVASNGLDRGYSADAFWFYTVGCVETFVGIFPVAGTSVGGQIEQRDVCTDPATPLLLASTGQGQIVPDEDFTINPGLSKADLHTVVTMCDSLSGACFPVTIDLVYERVDGKNSCNSDPKLPPPEGVITIFCSAEVSGVVTDGTTNFTPIPGNATFQIHRGFAD